jgi:hypothetical protein
MIAGQAAEYYSSMHVPFVCLQDSTASDTQLPAAAGAAASTKCIIYSSSSSSLLSANSSLICSKQQAAAHHMSIVSVHEASDA